MPNLDPSESPKSFFIFVDQSNTVTWHNFNFTRSLFSAPSAGSSDDVLMFIPNPSFNGFISPFLNNVTSNYRLEWEVEQARRIHAPEAPSRLAALFAFGTYADCERVSQKHGWSLDEVHEFQPAPSVPISIRKVNMEIVSVMRGAYTAGSWDAQSLDAIWSAYWRGETSITVDVPAPPPELRRQMTSECIWEYLVDGRLERV
jgi:hypothetical protein